MVIEHVKNVDEFIKKIVGISNEKSAWLILNTINNNSRKYVKPVKPRNGKK